MTATSSTRRPSAGSSPTSPTATPNSLQSSLDIVLRRFAEFQSLEGAFARRALIERAKGILMERHDVDDAVAFELLRTHSRSSNRKLIDIANAVDGRALLPGPPKPRDLRVSKPTTADRSLHGREAILAVEGDAPRRSYRRLAC